MTWEPSVVSLFEPKEREAVDMLGEILNREVSLVDP